MEKEQVQNRLTEITVGMTKENRHKVEDMAWELFHFAQDAARGRDEATAANRAFEELMGERQQQLTDYKFRVEQLEIRLANAQGERKFLRMQLMDHEGKIKQLEADLEKAKQEAQAMRDKLDEWCRALNRAEEMAESVKGMGRVQESR